MDGVTVVRGLRIYGVTAETETVACDYSIIISSVSRLLVFNFTAGRFIGFINFGGLCSLYMYIAFAHSTDSHAFAALSFVCSLYSILPAETSI